MATETLSALVQTGDGVSRFARGVRRVVWVGLLASLILAALLTVFHWRGKSRREHIALDGARSQAAQAAADIDRAFREAQELGARLARDLSDGTLPYTEIEPRMRAEFQQRPDLDGVAIAFEPFVYDPKQRLYQEYVSRQPDGSLSTLKGATYDYTAPPATDSKGPKTDWYHIPKTSGPRWNEPFLATGAGKYLIEYGVPFYRREQPGQIAGVVTVDFSLRDVRNLVSRLNLGATGYGVVFTTKGTYLAHPDARLVAKASIFDSQSGSEDAECHAAARRALAGESVAVDYEDPITGQEVWLLCEPIPSTGWVLGVVVRKAEHAQPPAEWLRQVVTIALVVGVALVCFIALAVRVERGTNRGLWATAATASLSSAGLVVLVWYLSWDVHTSRGVEVSGPTAAERYVEVYRQSLRRSEVVHVVPTGVELTAIRFPDPSTVTVAGYVWQRYSDSIPSDVTRGIVFPQQVDEPQMVTEVQRVKQGTEEVIVWSVLIALQQTYDPDRFPFDHRDIAIRLEPAELDANVVLVPDYGAYPLAAPHALPGLGRDIRVTNWYFRRSFFSYHTAPLTSTRGLLARTERTEAAQLSFEIDAQRNFIGPFVAYLSPALVAAGLAFALLVSGGTVMNWQDLITGLSYIAALFFVVVVAHASLRENIAAVGITYLEHVYILLYCTIAVVVMNLFFLARRPDLWLIQYRENLIIKLLYWPAITTVVLISTLAVFVYR